MTYRTIAVEQGSAAWHQERARRFTASEAPAMMGASKYCSRSHLLAQKHTGIEPDVDRAKQALFDKGHAAEAAARTLLEEELGDLYPVTAVHDADDRFLASVDGITFDDSTLFEHKLYSEDLAAHVRAGELEPHYFWQLEHQLFVTGAERVVFVCSDGTRARWAQMEYRPVAGRREALLAAWAQFAADLATYVPPAASAVEKIVAEPVDAFPAPVVHVSGQLALKDNFKVFEERLRHFLDHQLIRQPKSDQDFADLDVQIKAMKAAREALSAAEAQMLAQVQPVDQAKKTKDMLDKLLQQNCSMAEKLLKDEKERRRGEIVAAGVRVFEEHRAALTARLGKPYLPQIPTDFPGCIKGLKSLSSMEDKVATELARAKIAANEVADRIQANLTALREKAEAFKFLFSDAAALVLKQPEDCLAVITARIAEHQAEQARKEEDERARIRAEEQRKAEAEAAEKQRMLLSEISGIRQQAMIAVVGRAGVRKGGTIECIRQTLAETEAWPIEESHFGALTSTAQATKDQAIAEIKEALAQAEERAATPAPTAATAVASVGAPNTPPTSTSNVSPLRSFAGSRPPAQPVVAASHASLKLGVINERISPLEISAAGLAELGFPVIATEKGAKLYHEADFPRMVAALIERLHEAQMVTAEVA